MRMQEITIFKTYSIFYLIFISLYLFLMSCQSNTVETIKFHDIKWTVTIPPTFKKIAKEKWYQVKNYGKQEIEAALNKELSNKDAEITLLVYKSGPFHTIEASCKKYVRELKDKKYIMQLNQVTFETLVKAMPNTVLDSTSFNVLIDGKEFITQQIVINYDNGDQLITKSYRKFIGDYIFSINTLHSNSSKGESILKSIINSKFD